MRERKRGKKGEEKERGGRERDLFSPWRGRLVSAPPQRGQLLEIWQASGLPASSILRISRCSTSYFIQRISERTEERE